MKKLLIVFSIFCILISCEQKPKEFDFGLNTNEPVTINIIGGLDNFEGLEAVIAKFETLYPNCTVTYQKLDRYYKNLPGRLDNDKENIQLFLSELSTFINNKEFADIAIDLLDKENTGIDISNLSQDQTLSQTIDGKLFTVPLAMNPNGIVVNKTLLAKFNLTVPQNYSQFINACETLKKAGYIPIQANNGNIGLCTIYPYIANQIVHNPNYTSIFSELNSFTEGSSKYLADSFKRLETIVANQYCVYEETDGWKDNYNEGILNFLEGDVAFFPCSAETVSGMKKREEKSEKFIASPFEYEFIGTPISDDGQVCYWQNWQGISVNKLSKNENWARAFMNFLISKENIVLLASIKGMPANINGQSTDHRFASLYKIDKNRVCNASQFQNAFYKQLTNTFKRIVLPLNDPNRLDGEGAIIFFEEEIAKKREQ